MAVPPSIRGKMDLANDPFGIVAVDPGDQNQKPGIYLLLQVDYANGSDTQSEAILCSEFTGAFNYPYTSGNDTGLKYFTWGVSKDSSATNIIYSSNPVEYINVKVVNNNVGTNTPYQIKNIFPLKLVYENGYLFSYISDKDKRPLYLQIGGNGDDFTYKVMISKTPTDSTKTSFALAAESSFYNDGFAGYPYLLIPSDPGSLIDQLPFRNFQFFDLGAGDTTEVKVTTFNIVDNPDPNVKNSIYRANVAPNSNFLNMNMFVNYGSGNDAKDYLIFPGVDFYSSNPTTFPKNLLKTTPIYLLPNTYYPANFNYADVSGVCGPISSNGELTSVLNYFYFQWASGFPGTTTGAVVTRCAPGFITKGDPTQTVCGWTSSDECERSYFYNYCGRNETCSTCYGPCSGGLFCDVNTSFTPKYKVDTPFVCGKTPEPQKKTDWKEVLIIGSIAGGSIIILIVLLILFFSKKKQEPVVPDFSNY